MATQSPSDLLITAYKAQSSSAADAAALALRALWMRHAASSRTPKDLYDSWMGPAIALMKQSRLQQAELARALYMAMRRLENPNGQRFIVPALPPTDDSVLHSSLYFMAFVEGRPDGESLEDFPLAEALTPERLSRISAVGVTKSMDGGRLQMKYAIDKDPAPQKGYYRQLGPNPCGFCALLATRHDYGEHSFDASDARFEGEGECKVHDECHCVLRPYWSSVALSPTHDRADALWQEVRSSNPGKSNRALINIYSQRWKEEQAATVEASRAPEGRAA